MTTPQQSAATVPVGALYGLPGFTERFEQYENLYNVVTTAQQSAQTPFAPPASFQKTDIVFWWELETLWSNSVTFSAGTLANSPEAPYNLIQGPTAQTSRPVHAGRNGFRLPYGLYADVSANARSRTAEHSRPDEFGRTAHERIREYSHSASEPLRCHDV